MSTAHDIQLQIRQAAASEQAAGKYEDRYTTQMKSAGASMYAAFCTALKAAPEYAGRKLDDKAILRIYQSTKPRPWWDEHLKQAKYVNGKNEANRLAATRLIQWHVDPGAAEARHARGKVQQLSAQKRLSRQRVSESRGMNSHKFTAPTAKEAQRVIKAAANEAHAGRDLAEMSKLHMMAGTQMPLEELLGEANRLVSSARRVKAEDRREVFDILRVTAREIERYV